MFGFVQTCSDLPDNWKCYYYLTKKNLFLRRTVYGERIGEGRCVSHDSAAVLTLIETLEFNLVVSIHEEVLLAHAKYDTHMP